MNEFIQTPSKGAPIRHSWGIAVSRQLNSTRLLQTPGMILSEDVHGFGYTPIPANKRNRTSSFAAIPTPFRLAMDKDEYGIVDCFFMVGGVMFEAEKVTFPPGHGDNGQVIPAQAIFAKTFASSYAVLVIDKNKNSEACIEAIPYEKSGNSKLGERQRNPENYCYPLYKFDENGKVLIDLRLMPQIQKFEVF